MSRNLVLVTLLIFSSMAYSIEDKGKLKGIKLIYPNSQRTVSISLEYTNSKISKIDYLVDGAEIQKVSKVIDEKESKELVDMWKKNESQVMKAQTEIGCESAQMWVVEYQNSNKKVFCRNKEAIDSVAKFQKSVQFMLLDL